MSDVDDSTGATPQVREKSIGSTTVACPMLTQTNYTVWALRMKIVLRIHKVWSEIDPGTTKNEEKDCLAVGLIYQAIPESLIMQIGDVKDAKVLWESIRARHVGADRVKEARLQTLTAELDRLRMADSDSIDSFAGKLAGIASSSASLGETIEESKLVKKLLTVVPRRFIQIVASLEQILDLKTVAFDDIVGRLKAYEERIREADDSGGQTRVMLTRSTVGGGSNGGGWSGSSGGNSSGGTKASGGKNRKGGNKGGSFNPRGSGGSGSNPAQNPNRPNNQKQSNNRPNSNSDSNRNPKKDLSKIICYRCDKSGHYASKCPDRIQKFQESNFAEQDEDDEAVFFHETVFLNEEKVIPSQYNSQENDVWYLDNGASNHMTGNRSFFPKSTKE